MFNDKLHIFTYKNTIYQSKLELLAIFGQSLFSSTVMVTTYIFINKLIPRVHSSLYRGRVILIDLN
jgi:hypothetical protein